MTEDDIFAYLGSKKDERKERDNRIMELAPWITITSKTTYYVVHCNDLKVACMGPDDDSYILGRPFGRVELVCDNEDVYVIARSNGGFAVNNARKKAYGIARRLQEVVGEATVVSRWG